MRSRALLGVAAGTLSAVVLGGIAAPAGASPGAPDVQARASSWDEAAATLGTAGSLWEPRLPAGLSLRRGLEVVADNLAFAEGAVTQGDTSVGAQYGRGARSFRIQEKWADTGWAAEPAVSTSSAPVGTARLRIGTRGMRTTVIARVLADCFPQPADADPRPVPRRFRCTRADVLAHGGTLEMTARPASTMTAPGDTTIQITTRGLTYRELVRIARSVEQVAGTPTVAGSAQMVGMCRQMTGARMTAEQATGFAQSNGYVARVGSVDGQPRAVTMDYRPDRFTLAVDGGVVTSCTYG